MGLGVAIDSGGIVTGTISNYFLSKGGTINVVNLVYFNAWEKGASFSEEALPFLSQPFLLLCSLVNTA